MNAQQDAVERAARVLAEHHGYWDDGDMWCDKGCSPVRGRGLRFTLDQFARHQAEMLAAAGPIGGETVTEWEVTGDPGYGYPPYRFVFGAESSRSDDPERDLRAFLSVCGDWKDGPHVRRREVTRTEWREVEA